MTYKEKYLLTTQWQERALVMNMYHRLMQMKRKKWGVRATAQYFGVSIAIVSQNIKLANNITLVESLSSKRRALKELK